MISNLMVDFDGVIHDPNNVDKGFKMGNPMPGAKEALNKLRRNFYIIVFTVRGDKQYVRDWLDFYSIPYDDVTDIKKKADYYIDDKAIKFISWDQTLKEVK